MTPWGSTEAWNHLSDDELRARLIARRQPEGYADYLVAGRDDGMAIDEAITLILGDR